MKKVLISIIILISVIFFVSCKKQEIALIKEERIACLTQLPDWYRQPAGSFKVVIVDNSFQFHDYWGWHEQKLYYGCNPIILYDGGFSNQVKEQVLEKLNRDGYAVLVGVVNPQYSGQMTLSNE